MFTIEKISRNSMTTWRRSSCRSLPCARGLMSIRRRRKECWIPTCPTCFGLKDLDTATGKCRKSMISRTLSTEANAKRDRNSSSYCFNSGWTTMQLCIRGGPVRPMSELAKLVKDTANYVLLSGFWISWKHIVQQMPWYCYYDYCRMLAVTPRRDKNCLEETMMQHHNKTEKILWEQRRKSVHPTSHKEELQREPVNAPTSGQFDLEEDLEADVYNPLVTPTDMPVQDEDSTPVQEDLQAELVQSNVVTPAEDRMLDEVDNSVSIASSSQEKWWKANFISLTYWQQEVAGRGDADDFLAMSPSATPKATPVTLLKTTPQAMPKVTPQSSPDALCVYTSTSGMYQRWRIKLANGTR